LLPRLPGHRRRGHGGAGVAARPVPGDEADDRLRARAPRHLGPRADVMLVGRSRLPVLAEISGPTGGGRGWGLRRAALCSVGRVVERLGEGRVVLVSGTGEAATVASIALAAAASASGRRTALSECDLAQPRLAAQLGLAAEPGLHEYLRWEA